MTQPIDDDTRIRCSETVSLGTKRVEKSYTYDELLEIFDDDFNVVRPLVLRCQRYEQRIKELEAACKAVLDAVIRCDLEGKVLWIEEPHQLPGVHESVEDRLRAALTPEPPQ